MDLSREYGKIGKGITSSSSKKNVLNERLGAFTKSLKKLWYKKSLTKLESIKKGELSIDDYILEVTKKIS